MNHTLFTLQQNDQIKPIIDPSKIVSNKKAQNNFATKNAELSTSRNNQNKDTFASFMSKAKEKNEAAQNRASQKDDNTVSEHKTNEQLHTKVAKENNQSTTETALMDIAELNAKITQILANNAEAAEVAKPSQTSDVSDEILIVTTAHDEEELSPLFEAMQLLRDRIEQQITEIKENRPSSDIVKDEELKLSLLEDIAKYLGNILESKENLTIIYNQSPEDLAEIQNLIAKLFSQKVDEQDEEMVQALAAKLAELAPPLKQPQKTTEIRTNAITSETKTVLAPELAKSQDTLNSKHYTQERYDANYSLESRIDTRRENALGKDQSFKGMVQDNIAKLAGASNQQTAQDTQATPQQSAGDRFLQGSSGLDILFSTTGETAIYAPNPQAGLNQANALAQNIATSPVTQASHATQAHPATQAVMINVQRAVKAGNDNTNIKIQLDPPELGRVEVKMSISKDNASKIVLTVEKPETYALLQRDSQALQQALQDSGLDSNSDLSFELANDDHAFHAKDNNAGQTGGKSGSNENGNDDGDIIETTMDLSVDPETGHLRYSIMV